MQSNHFMSHDLDLLESYVHDCIQQLPKLPTPTDTAVLNAGTQIPTRCSSYHTMCTSMLKEVVALLSLFSPRLCRLIGQVWDLASLNVFVLLQVANESLQEIQQMRGKFKFIERFHAQSLQQQTMLVQRYEDELGRYRTNEQELRAELQRVRRRANRLAVENGQLHLVVNRIFTVQATTEATHSDPLEQLSVPESDTSTSCEDAVAIGDVNDHELYEADNGEEDALARVAIIHPIQSYSTDFEQLFHALFESEERNVHVLNELDRFINSTAVALLWRHGTTEEEQTIMHRMLRASTVGTQTDSTLTKTSFHLNEDLHRVDGRSLRESTLDHSSMHKDKENNQLLPTSATNKAPASTQHQAIPATLREQFHTQPRVHHVLEKTQLNRILLRLYLEKVECDARTLRRQRIVSARVTRSESAINAANDGGALFVAVVRIPLHRFMKEFFLARYELQALADFHMMEVVKSCLYYHQQRDIAYRRSVVVTSSALVGCLPEMPMNNTRQAQHRPHDQAASSAHLRPDDSQQLQLFDAADVRVALFARLCELVPFDGREAAIDTAGVDGNLPTCLTNAVIDVLGDIVELDPAVPSLAAVEESSSEATWAFPRKLAHELLTRHLLFVEPTILEDAKAQLARLASVLPSAFVEDAAFTNRIAVDVFLALFATTWTRSDQRLESKLRETFRHQLALASPLFRKKAADAITAVDLSTVEKRDEETILRGVVDKLAIPIGRTTVLHSTTMLPMVARGAAVTASASSLELLAQAWSMLENETLSSLDVEELESTFEDLLEAKHINVKHCDQPFVRSDGHSPNGAADTIGGVTEKEFVFHTLQVLRRRRNNYGLRTNSKRPPCWAVSGSEKDEHFESAEADEMPIPLESLKPGLTNDESTRV